MRVEHEPSTDQVRDASRREFLTGLAAATLAGAAGLETSPAFAATTKPVPGDRTADVVVIGAGAAGMAAAIAAKRAGAEVLLVEKAASLGGTTIKSDGAYWIPNNHYMRSEGIEDPKLDAIAFMARGSYPFLFRGNAPRFGLDEHQYALIETFYDSASSVLDELEGGSVLSSGMVMLPDYQDHFPQNKALRGRVLLPKTPKGDLGRGRELVRQLSAWLQANGVPIIYKHQVTEILRDRSGRVTGVLAQVDKSSVTLHARRGVVFGSGGYTHDQELMTNFQAGPVWGGCAVPTNRGDFIRAAGSLGAKLGNMANAWRAELILEEALETPSVAKDVWQPPGDSMILVNKYGERVTNEMRNYHERAKAHFVWDSQHSEYRNKLLFMIYDQRTAELYAGNHPLPATGDEASYVISAPSLKELGLAIQERLDKHADRIGDEKLSADFDATLSAQIDRFNVDAAKGVDTQFGRGTYPYDAEWHTAIESIPVEGTKWPKNPGPNLTLYPIDKGSSFKAIILGAGTLDTNGGPVTNAKAQVLDLKNEPIPGLYGAGNCIASPAGAAYWGAGGTLGPALTFGTIAGRNAAAERRAEKQT